MLPYEERSKTGALAPDGRRMHRGETRGPTRPRLAMRVSDRWRAGGRAQGRGWAGTRPAPTSRKHQRPHKGAAGRVGEREGPPVRGRPGLAEDADDDAAVGRPAVTR